MLVPAGVLVLFILGSIAVDSSIAFLAQRELTAAAAAAANDAAGAAVSDATFYDSGGPGDAPGRIVLDPARAGEVAAEAVATRVPRGLHDIVPTVAVAGDQVCVTVTARVDTIFAKAIPGAPTSRVVTGRAVATAVPGSTGSRARRSSDAVCGS